MKNPLVKSLLIVLVAYLLSAGTAFGVTTYLYSPQAGGAVTPVATPPTGGSLNIDPNAPKNAECPTNGQMYTTAEAKVWQSRRPLFAMIENTVEARPQSGLNSADVLYEASPRVA